MKRGAAKGIVLATAVCGALLLGAPAAGAATATATFTAGSLGFVTAPPNVSFSATLNGTDQTVTTTQPIDVSDATGSGAGWNLTATSTTFGSGSHSLSTGATTVASTPSIACDAGSSCLKASVNGSQIAYPYTMPAAATAPTATKMFDASLNSGMGDQTITPTWSLAVPATTYAGTYTSTWTISLVSGP